MEPFMTRQNFDKLKNLVKRHNRLSFNFILFSLILLGMELMAFIVFALIIKGAIS